MVENPADATAKNPDQQPGGTAYQDGGIDPYAGGVYDAHGQPIGNKKMN
jgi:hypothetical protein